MGRVHLEALRRVENVDVVEVAATSLDKARAAGAGYNVLNVTGDWHDVINDPSIDAVHVATPNASHFPIAKAALEAGKHVLCEKPLAMSSAEAQELTDLAAAKKLRGGLCHNLRYYPMVQQMRRMREAGEFGDILVVQGTYSQDWMLYETDWNWRVDPKVSGAVAGDGRYRLALFRHGRACHRTESVGGVQRPADLPSHPQATTLRGAAADLFGQYRAAKPWIRRSSPRFRHNSVSYG